MVHNRGRIKKQKKTNYQIRNMIVKDIILKRKIQGNYNSLFGILEIHTQNHGVFYFSTVENDEKKIQSGNYSINYTPSHKFNRETLEIKGVNNRYGIRIHPANRGNELQGCIAVGLANYSEEIPQQIFYSKFACNQLEAMLFYKEHKITIKDINNGKKNIIKNSRKYTSETIGSHN